MSAEKSPARKYVCVVSDASGRTAERVVHATLSQFEDVPVDVDLISRVRSADEIRTAVAKARKRKGLIAYTLVEPTLRSEVISLANEAGVATVDLIGPLMTALSDFLTKQPAHRAGLFAEPGEEHYRHLEAVSFTVRHDDGLIPNEIGLAEIVLVGPSRTSKTPLSVYLAHTRGLKVANVPIAEGIEPLDSLKELPPGRVAGLTMHSGVLAKVRRQCLEEMGNPVIQYAQPTHVESELRFCHAYYRRRPAWPVIDVTSKSIEEIAVEVCARTIDSPARRS